MIAVVKSNAWLCAICHEPATWIVEHRNYKSSGTCGICDSCFKGLREVSLDA